ncbi:PREDICTED: transmembrane protein 88B [Condylura cristata]|uniref:transmembrane protein 88B n=1 Tax=Condylura cristata TaxID=143302 RepID=UPI0003345ADB|nr:PREDICTED: transmembrane protein 88B [Condylura cristata]
MSEWERETEEDEGEVASDTVPMLPRLPDRGGSALLSAGGASLAAQALGTLLHLLLPASVFLLVLLPAAAIVYLGFLCHSRVHPAPRPACRAVLSDRGSAALIVSGFLSLPPLLVLASAARARLARRLGPLLPLPIWSPRLCRPAESSDPGEQQLCAWV